MVMKRIREERDDTKSNMDVHTSKHTMFLHTLFHSLGAAHQNLHARERKKKEKKKRSDHKIILIAHKKQF